MTTRTPRKSFRRQDAVDPSELELILDNEITQRDIETKVINRCINNEAIQRRIPLINQIMLYFGITIGLLMFARGLIDGALSMIGLWLRLIYFATLSFSYGFDSRLSADRWSFLTPALSGLLLTLAQLVGMFITNGPFTCDSFVTCL